MEQAIDVIGHAQCHDAVVEEGAHPAVLGVDETQGQRFPEAVVAPCRPPGRQALEAVAPSDVEAAAAPLQATSRRPVRSSRTPERRSIVMLKMFNV